MKALYLAAAGKAFYFLGDFEKIMSKPRIVSGVPK